jgi:hypothetical protein
VAIPKRVLDILQCIGQVAAEIPGSHEDVRAFVTVSRFNPDSEPGAAQRYAYFGPRGYMYGVRRFQVSRELLDNDYDVSEEELWDSQRIILPDEAALEFVLRLWLTDLDAGKLRLPKRSRPAAGIYGFAWTRVILSRRIARLPRIDLPEVDSHVLRQGPRPAAALPGNATSFP